MTSPLTGERPRYEEPGTRGAATLRRPPSKSLALARLGRGVNRQWMLTLVIAVTVTAAGVGYDLSGGLQPLRSLIFWAPIGVAAGLVIGFVRELGRNTITSLSSFGKNRGYAILGAAPELTPRVLRQLPPDKRTPIGCLAFMPSSPFATAFRNLQSAIATDGVVAFAGAVANEGATTAAMCTAISASQQGRTVIVIDCDLRRRSLTRALGFDPDEGLVDACEEPSQWENFVGEEDETGVHFIPASRSRGPWRNPAAAPGFNELILRLRQSYDLIVLDCPPILVGADGAATAAVADKCVLVTAWDRTPISAVRHAMGALQRRPRAQTAVYVNRVPPEYRFGRLRGE
ncbi:CpsD/CapB family tyrosine-protein kinase [Candidatus Viadribacter manganicus]|uniref:CpsD/CapB family tyrosine-protein kinase n=1 Tax=Candidatus Viadribacter manganicus TaxID=1759059 RepID=UPI0012E9DB3C|nr:CpsD/CapB family tyrosine-protein kinase [Candidatus Viadribacter manganicus]